MLGKQWHSGSALKDRHNVNEIQVLEPSLPQITMNSDNNKETQPYVFTVNDPSLMF